MYIVCRKEKSKKNYLFTSQEKKYSNRNKKLKYNMTLPPTFVDVYSMKLNATTWHRRRCTVVLHKCSFWFLALQHKDIQNEVEMLKDCEEFLKSHL